MRTLLLLVALLSVSEWTNAQSRARPDPADPSAATPPPPYQPTFSDYQPFQDEKVRSWKEVNKEVADNPGMGSMKHRSGATTPGMESKLGDAPKREGAASHDMGSMKAKPGAATPGMDAKTGAAAKKEGAASHDMGSMKAKPGAAMPGMDAKTGAAAKGKGGPTGHDMGSMQHQPGTTKPEMDKPAAAAPKSKEGLHTMAMAKPQAAAGHTARIAGTGSVLEIDKTNAKVKLTHDPIAAMGWPKMTMFFRLKESSLADQVKIGDKVEFTLEKSAAGYVISGFKKPIAESSPTVNPPKPAAHGKH